MDDENVNRSPSWSSMPKNMHVQLDRAASAPPAPQALPAAGRRSMNFNTADGCLGYLMHDEEAAVRMLARGCASRPEDTELLQLDLGAPQSSWFSRIDLGEEEIGSRGVGVLLLLICVL